MNVICSKLILTATGNKTVSKLSSCDEAGYRLGLLLLDVSPCRTHMAHIIRTINHNGFFSIRDNEREMDVVDEAMKRE